MLKRKNLQKKWENLVKKGSLDYESLNKNERVWFNIEPLTISGLIDHYTNYGAEKNSDLLEDLEHLNLPELSNLFKEINNFFKTNKPPKDIDKRNDEIFNWSDEKKQILDKNEKIFWSKSSLLEEILLTHINEKIF